MKIYYKSEEDETNYECILFTENEQVITYWLYKKEWEKRVPDGTYKFTKRDFNPGLKRISRAKAVSILFLDSI